MCAAAVAGAENRSLVDVWQDSLVSSTKVISLDRDTRLYVDSVRRVIQRFYVDRFRHFQDPAAPYFLFMSKDAPLAMGIGGVNYGAGYAGLGGDLLIGNCDIVGDPSTPGRMYAPNVLGWHAGVQYNILRNLFVSAMASQTRYLPRHEVASDEYKYEVMTAVNVFWNLTARMQVGAEFDLGLRRSFSGEHRYARRIGMMAQFSF